MSDTPRALPNMGCWTWIAVCVVGLSFWVLLYLLVRAVL